VESRPRFVPGRLVRSLSGRDAGRYFVVVDVIDDRFVAVADGDARPLRRPKKKNAKHLEAYPYVDHRLAAGLSNGGRVTDADVREALARSPAMGAAEGREVDEESAEGRGDRG